MTSQCKWAAFGILSLLFLGGAAGGGVSHADEAERPRFRVDCRFYGTNPSFCYASAIYSVAHESVSDIKYGVGCELQTIYNDSGTASPQEKVSDGIRPRTAATPKIELVPEQALQRAGTYTSKLEIDAGKLLDGICYVQKLERRGSAYSAQYFEGEWNF